MGPLWVQWIFFAACMTVASYYAAAVVTRLGGNWHSGAHPASLGYPLSHLAMALGMAAMFAPIGNPLPRLVWLVIFGAAAAWFATQTLRTAVRTDATGHHLVANLAMLFMVLLPHSDTAHLSVATPTTPGHGTHSTAADPAHAGHQATTGALGDTWFEGPIGTVLIVVLIAYFAVYAVRSMLVLAAVAAPRAGAAVSTGVAMEVDARRTWGQPRIDALSHVVMGVAMAVMFGLML